MLLVASERRLSDLSSWHIRFRGRPSGHLLKLTKPLPPLSSLQSSAQALLLSRSCQHTLLHVRPRHNARLGKGNLSHSTSQEASATDKITPLLASLGSPPLSRSSNPPSHRRPAHTPPAIGLFLERRLGVTTTCMHPRLITYSSLDCRTAASNYDLRLQSPTP